MLLALIKETDLACFLRGGLLRRELDRLTALASFSCASELYLAAGDRAFKVLLDLIPIEVPDNGKRDRVTFDLAVSDLNRAAASTIERACKPRPFLLQDNRIRLHVAAASRHLGGPFSGNVSRISRNREDAQKGAVPEYSHGRNDITNAANPPLNLESSEICLPVG